MHPHASSYRQATNSRIHFCLQSTSGHFGQAGESGLRGLAFGTQSLSKSYGADIRKSLLAYASRLTLIAWESLCQSACAPLRSVGHLSLVGVSDKWPGLVLRERLEAHSLLGACFPAPQIIRLLVGCVRLLPSRCSAAQRPLRPGGGWWHLQAQGQAPLRDVLLLLALWYSLGT